MIQTIEKIKFLAIVAAFVFFADGIAAQNSNMATLGQCHEKAIAAYPQLSDKTLVKDASDLRIKNIIRTTCPNSASMVRPHTKVM